MFLACSEGVDFELCKRNPETKERDFELTDGMSLEDLRKKVFAYMGKQRLIFQIRGWTDKLTKKTPRFGLTPIIKSIEYAAYYAACEEGARPEAVRAGHVHRLGRRILSTKQFNVNINQFNTNKSSKTA